MDPEKAPETDGLPAQVYKTFWDELVFSLISALTYAYDQKTLSVSQRREPLNVYQKKDADPHFIKNWRLLTLLNCDYKIASKAIANRIRTAVPKLISNDQTGFLKWRFTGENVRLICSIIHQEAEQHISGLLLFIDFEKTIVQRGIRVNIRFLNSSGTRKGQHS